MYVFLSVVYQCIPSYQKGRVGTPLAGLAPPQEYQPSPFDNWEYIDKLPIKTHTFSCTQKTLSQK
jgi:hypothetical protein